MIQLNFETCCSIDIICKARNVKISAELFYRLHTVICSKNTFSK